MQFSIEIADQYVADVISALCDLGDYPLYLATTGDSPAMSASQFANYVVRGYIKGVTADYVAKQAEDAARQTLEDIPIDDATGV